MDWKSPDSVRACGICGRVKPPSEFHADKTKAGGFRSDCKECVCARARDYRARNRSKVEALNRSYYSKNREQILIQVAEYRRRNKEKRAQRDKIRFWASARRMMARAERDATIRPLPDAAPGDREPEGR
jgi:hypothetical protein